MSVDNLRKRAAQPNGTHTDAEVCFIGLAAYFEAFCKDQFAAILNVCPESLSTFSRKRQDATLPLGLLPAFIRKLDYRLGSLIAEQYDFGSAKALNGLFLDLLGTTPFSKKEATEYGKLLNDRNLLVHHGGIYTQKYSGQTFKKHRLRLPTSEIYYNSLMVSFDDLVKWCDWTDKMARKIAHLSHDGLLDFTKAHSVRLTKERRKALESFIWLD